MVALLMTVGILLVGATFWLVARLIALPRLQVESHLRHVESYGFSRSELEVDPTARSVLAAAAESFGLKLLTQVPRLPALTRAQLSAAGIYQMSVETVHGYRAMAAIFVPLVIILLSFAGGGFSILIVIIALILLVLVWYGSGTLLLRRGRLRLDQIDRSLPQLVDLLVATVEAGVGFGGALTSVATRFRGPLGVELRMTLQQQQLGVSTERALGDLADRCDTAYVRAFVRTVIRAESHGMSIGPVMRHLASDIRQRRRDAAREKIQKAPIKLLIPLLIFILLPLMLVVFFPAGWNLLHVLGNVH